MTPSPEREQARVGEWVRSVALSLVARAIEREPDFVIGSPNSPYLRRWWVLPRNPIFNIYVHEILRSDDDRALHDHPWINVSILAVGSYTEVTPKGRFLRMAGSVIWRMPSASHRLEVNGSPCWTVFVTGPRVRNWGFHCPRGWVPWQRFTSPENKGQVGRGCA